MDFGTKLKILRVSRGLTQGQLAAMTGVPNTRISEFESGRIVPGSEWMETIKRELRWPQDESVFDAFELEVRHDPAPELSL